MKALTYLMVLLCLAACGDNKHSAGSETAETTGEAPAADNVLSPEEAEAGWTLLFDGKTLDSWRGYNRPDLPKNGWVVENGEMVILATPDPKPEDFGGDIITKAQFGNFELVFDFKITEMANSGVFYFVKEDSNLPMWANAPEHQILDHEAYAKSHPDFDLKTHCTCDNYDLQAAPDNYMKPVGEWNHGRIIHKDGHVEHWLNGNKCIEYQVGSEEFTALVKASKFSEYPDFGLTSPGHIGLQDHQHEVRFKNIKIKSL